MADHIHQLTPAQRAQLRALYEAGAHSSAQAIEPTRAHAWNGTVVAILIRIGLVATRERRCRPEYWLTAEGVGEVRKPTEAKRHG